MAGNFSLPTILANLTAGNEPLSLVDGDFNAVYNPLVSLNTFSNYYTDVGSANSYSITVSSPQTVTQAAGLRVQFIASNGNTGASTLQINALAAKNIKNTDGSALTNGQIVANGIFDVIYDGTQYLLLNPLVPVSPSPIRSYLAGLTLSTAGGSGTMSIAAGQAADSTNARMMSLSALSKTTSAWAVGTGNGGIDTGSIANTTWYHFFEIMRTDTNVVDVLFSLSATSPTMPTNYTLFRRIGSGKTDGSAHWVAFTQDGDYFRWSAGPTLDFNTTNPGTSAVTQTLANVPTGVNVTTILSVVTIRGTGIDAPCYMSDLAATDEAASETATPLYNVNTDVAAAGASGSCVMNIRTNTSAQIRYRFGSSAADTNIRAVALGWLDRRGRDS